MAAQVAFISRIMTLLPGDVIATGTPSGIGPMQPGDVVEIRVEGIGTLRNRLVSAYRSSTAYHELFIDQEGSKSPWEKGDSGGFLGAYKIPLTPL